MKDFRVEKPEPYEPIDWNNFMNRLIGFDEWVAKWSNVRKQKDANNE